MFGRSQGRLRVSPDPLQPFASLRGPLCPASPAGPAGPPLALMGVAHRSMMQAGPPGASGAARQQAPSCRLPACGKRRKARGVPLQHSVQGMSAQFAQVGNSRGSGHAHRAAGWLAWPSVSCAGTRAAGGGGSGETRGACDAALPAMSELLTQWPTHPAPLRGSSGWRWGSVRACALHRAGGRGPDVAGAWRRRRQQGSLQLQCSQLCVSCLVHRPRFWQHFQHDAAGPIRGLHPSVRTNASADGWGGRGLQPHPASSTHAHGRVPALSFFRQCHACKQSSLLRTRTGAQELPRLPLLLPLCLLHSNASQVFKAGRPSPACHPSPACSVGRVGRADTMGLAISLVSSVPEKVG